VTHAASTPGFLPFRLWLLLLDSTFKRYAGSYMCKASLKATHWTQPKGRWVPEVNIATPRGAA
jgi:hypothetical protein